MQESTRKVRKAASQVVLDRMQLTLRASRQTPHGASRLVQAMPAWLVKTRRASSRHCRDARAAPPTPHPPHTHALYPSPPSRHLSASHAILSRMQFILRANRGTPQGRFELPSRACLVDENPTCSVPACEDLLSQDCGHAQ